MTKQNLLENDQQYPKYCNSIQYFADYHIKSNEKKKCGQKVKFPKLIFKTKVSSDSKKYN